MPLQWAPCFPEINPARAAGARGTFLILCGGKMSLISSATFSSTFGLSHYYEAMPHKWEDF